MSQSIDQLKTQIGELSSPERAELAYFLIASLEPEEDGVDEAWRVEIDRRIAEIQSGQAVGRPVEEVIRDLREQYP